MIKVFVYPAIVLALLAIAYGCGSSGPATTDTGGMLQCQQGQAVCGGACVTLADNAAHCGVCDNACPVGTSCLGGSCSCQTGLSNCTGLCTDISSDPANCGVCGTACSAAQVCSLSACADGCDASLSQCGQSCVDLTSSLLHCGVCNKCGERQAAFRSAGLVDPTSYARDESLEPRV